VIAERLLGLRARLEPPAQPVVIEGSVEPVE